MHIRSSTQVGTRRSPSPMVARVSIAAVSIFLLAGIAAPAPANAAPAGCAALQAKYPDGSKTGPDDGEITRARKDLGLLPPGSREGLG